MEELQRERERAVRRKAFEVYHRSPSLEPAGEQAQPRRPFPERTCILRE
jgi:hypothetical protein